MAEIAAIRRHERLMGREGRGDVREILGDAFGRQAVRDDPGRLRRCGH